MDKKKNDLKALLQRCGPEKPPPDFTVIVMNEVTEVADRVFPGVQLQSLVKHAAGETLSTGFTANVMNKLETPSLHKAYKPLFTPRLWWTTLTATVLVLFLASTTLESYDSPQGLTPYLIRFGNTIVTNLSNDVSSTYVITLVCVCSLMVLDYLLKNKMRSARD
jgi:hypothetical protein